MNLSRLKTRSETVFEVWSDAGIVGRESAEDGELRYRLDNGAGAALAAGCLLQPEAGDRVLLYRGRDGSFFITQVLHSERCSPARITVPGADKVLLEQQEISVLATARLRLTSARDLDLTAVAGDMTIEADNLFSSVRGQWIEQARHRISKAVSYMLDATGLMRLHGEQGLLTASKDIKVDAERISVG